MYLLTYIRAGAAHISYASTSSLSPPAVPSTEPGMYLPMLAKLCACRIIRECVNCLIVSGDGSALTLK